MADEVDFANERVEAHRVTSLRRVLTEKFDAGVPGDCIECGEDSPRLVGGRCAYCRDGRYRPCD